MHDLRGIKGRHRRRRALKPFNLHKAGMGNWALAQSGGALVRGQHIWIAVLAHAAGGARLKRIIPSAGAHADDADAHIVADLNAAEAGAAVIEHPHDVTCRGAKTGE